MKEIDNYDLYRMHEARQEAWLRKQPICPRCKEHIQDEYGYEIDGEGLLCGDCAQEWLKEQMVDIDERTEEGW